jgi:hypothetical protein
LGALLLMAAGLGLMGMPSAQAAQIDVSFVLVDGSEMVIGGSPFPLFDPANPTSSGIVGQYDDVTGEFEGEFVSPARRATQTVDAPIAGTIDVVIDTVPISSDGHIDPVTGAVEVTSVFDLEMLFEQLVPTATPNSPVPLNVLCTIPAITLELTTDPPGFPPAVLGEGFALADDGFEVAEPECEGSVAGVDPAIVGLVRGGLIDRLSLPTTDTAIFLEFAPGDLTDAEPLEPLAAPPTTVAPVAPVAPAVAVQAAPRLTG